MFGEHFMERQIMGYRAPQTPPAELMEVTAELLSRPTPDPPPAAVPTLEDLFGRILERLWLNPENHDFAAELTAFRDRVLERFEAQVTARREALQAEAEALRTSCRAKLDESRRLVVEYNQLRSRLNELRLHLSEASVNLAAVRASKPPPNQYPTQLEIEEWKKSVAIAAAAVVPWEDAQRELVAEMQAVAGRQAAANEDLAKLAEEEQLVRAQLEGIPLPGPYGLQAPTRRG